MDYLNKSLLTFYPERSVEKDAKRYRFLAILHKGNLDAIVDKMILDMQERLEKEYKFSPPKE